MPNPPMEVFSATGPQMRLSGNAAVAPAGDVFIELAADNVDRFVYVKIGLDVKSASAGFETGSLFLSSVRTGIMKKFLRIGVAELANVVLQQQGDTGLLIQGDGLYGNPPFKVIGGDRGGTAAGTYYVTMLENGNNPGIKTNCYMCISGSLGTAGDPVPKTIAGQNNYMLGVRSDAGEAPTFVIQTNTGPIMLAYDENANLVFELTPAGDVLTEGRVEADAFVADGEVGLTTSVAIPNGPTLQFTGGLLTAVT